MAIVITDDGKVKKVKNLGWLLRNWKQVKSFAVVPDHSQEYGWNCMLVAYMRDGRRYESGFADMSVLVGWLDRPVFRDVKVEFSNVGMDLVCHIGDAEYNKIKSA